MKHILTFTFLSIALSAMSQWTYTGGPQAGGNCRGLYAGNGVILAGVNNNLIRSTDDGQSWEQILTVDAGISPDCFTDAGSTIIMGTNNGDRTFRSNDGGANWEAITSGMPDIFGFPSAVPTHAASLNGSVFMSGTNFIRRTTDLGNNWETMSIDGLCYGFDETNGELWAAPGGAIQYSTDGGDTWTPTTTVPTIGFGTSATCFLRHNGRLWVGTNMAGGQGLFYTDDNGETWVNNGNNLSVAYDLLEHNGVLYCTTGLGMYHSTDEGATWEPVDLFTFNGGGSGQMAMSGDVLWVATGGGVGSYNTMTEEAELIGLPTTEVISIASGNGFAMSVAQGDLYVSPNSDPFLWTLVDAPAFNGLNITDVYYDDGSFYVVAADFFSANLFASSDNGQTWEQLSVSDIGQMISSVYSYNPILVESNTSSSLQIWYSNDDGQSFNEANITSDGGLFFITLNEFHHTASSVWAGLSNGFLKSTDAGQNWVRLLNPFNNAGEAMIKGWEDRLIGVFAANFGEANKLAQSTDGGETWTEFNTGLPSAFEVPVKLFQVGETVYVQISPLAAEQAGAIYQLNEGGSAWTNELGALPHAISEMTTDANGNLLVSTLSGGTWTFSGTIGVEDQVASSLQFAYPNPAADLVYLQGSVGGELVRVFDISGKERKQAQIMQHGGCISLRELPSGLYFLRSENGLRTWKVIKQ